MKYLVYAIYPNLGIHVRVTGYETEEEMLDYVSALRMCDTPYLVQEFKRGYPMMVDHDYAGLPKQKVIDYLNEYVDSLEDARRMGREPDPEEVKEVILNETDRP